MLMAFEAIFADLANKLGMYWKAQVRVRGGLRCANNMLDEDHLQGLFGENFSPILGYQASTA